MALQLGLESDDRGVALTCENMKRTSLSFITSEIGPSFEEVQAFSFGSCKEWQ